MFEKPRRKNFDTPPMKGEFEVILPMSDLPRDPVDSVKLLMHGVEVKIGRRVKILEVTDYNAGGDGNRTPYLVIKDGKNSKRYELTGQPGDYKIDFSNSTQVL